jgi:type II secretory pathway pseudopilin PulG
MFNNKYSYGFSILETIVVSLIFTTIFGLVGINLLSSKERIDIQAVTSQLYSDIKNQQIKAMTGESDDSLNPTDQGIYIDKNSYILFKSNIFDPNSPDNIKISLEDNLEFDNVLFDQSMIIFEKGSGEISNFTDGQNSLKIINSNTNQGKRLIFNRFGTVTNID